jgi:hypothetical protein
MSGWDMVVETTPAAGPGQYPTTTVRIKPKQTTLSDNNAQVDLWLKEQPNALEVQTQYDYEFIKKKLQEYLNPGEEVTTEAPVAAESIAPATPSKPVLEETDLTATLGNHATDFTLETAVAGNKSTVNKFDDLFN